MLYQKQRRNYSLDSNVVKELICFCCFKQLRSDLWKGMTFTWVHAMSRTCASSTLFHSGKMTKLNVCKCRSTISLSGLQCFCTAAEFFFLHHCVVIWSFLLSVEPKISWLLLTKCHSILVTLCSVLWWLKNCQLFVSLILIFLISLCQSKYIRLWNNTVRKQLKHNCLIFAQFTFGNCYVTINEPNASASVH